MESSSASTFLFFSSEVRDMDHKELELSANTCKALAVQLGSDAGTEIATILRRMASQIDELKRNKVEVTHVIPASVDRDPVWESRFA